MSWDIQIGEYDDGDFNLTYNYGFVFNEAGVNVRELDGMFARLVKLRLQKVRAHIEREYAALKEMEWARSVSEGWGTIDLLHEHLGWMILACVKYPDAEVSVG